MAIRAALAVLAVMTYRAEFAPQWGGHGHVTVHSLNRLGRGDGPAIAERITGGKALPDAVLRRILEQTDGIPLFIEELTKTVLEAGFLEEQENRYVLNGPLPALAIPTTLRDSLMARLDRLAPVKRVIQAAACIGREFGARLLAEALPMGAAKLENALGQLLGAQLIFRRGGAHVQRGEFAIGHPLIKAGNDFWTMSGGRVCTAMFRSWIVLGLQGLGRIDEAGGLNAANIAHCRETGDRYMEPEGVRPRGELTLEAGTPDIEAAERSFREAIAIAQAHGAKSWELRAAMSLARLLRSRDRRSEAVAGLEPAPNWFSEGLETADIRQAGSLLAALA